MCSGTGKRVCGALYTRTLATPLFSATAAFPLVKRALILWLSGTRESIHQECKPASHITILRRLDSDATTKWKLRNVKVTTLERLGRSAARGKQAVSSPYFRCS